MKYNENGTIDYEEFNSLSEVRTDGGRPATTENLQSQDNVQGCGSKQYLKETGELCGGSLDTSDGFIPIRCDDCKKKGCGKEFKIKNYIFMCNERHLCPSCQEKA